MNHPHSHWRDAERFRSLRDWDRADLAYRLAIAESPRTDLAIAYGVFLGERQQFGEAIRQLMQGLDAAQADGNRDAQVVIWENLANLYRELGDHDLAQRFLRQVLAARGDAGAGELLQWSADALHMGKTKLADRLARSAFEMLEDSDKIELQADAYGLLGITAARAGKLRRAVYLLIRAARGHQFAGDDRGLGTDYLNLAEVFGLLGRHAWQLAFLDAALKQFQQAGMPHSVHRVNRRLRDVQRLAHYRRTEAKWN